MQPHGKESIKNIFILGNNSGIQVAHYEWNAPKQEAFSNYQSKLGANIL